MIPHLPKRLYLQAAKKLGRNVAKMFALYMFFGYLAVCSTDVSIDAKDSPVLLDLNGWCKS